ncbi:hypothetical protein [Chryseobacterium sp. RLHN22]|uniref:hypothetical protein n=1 Tax=Chryseobacterium sp. RLHN22 TaxID=3437885 RepID=UPI003D9B2283
MSTIKMDYEILCYKNVRENTVRIEMNEIINEVDYFTFIVQSNVELDNHCLLITDIPVEITVIKIIDGQYFYTVKEDSVRNYFKNQDFDKVFDLYKARFSIPNFVQNILFYKLFINYPIGICDIVLVSKDNYEQISTIKLNVVSSKIDDFEFESLVSYVESKGSSIWAKFSLLKQQANNFNDEDRLDWLLIFCDNFINEFRNKYLFYFQIDKITTLENNYIIETYNGYNAVSEDSILWLLTNLEVLTATNSYDPNKLLINNRTFFPTEILSSHIKETTDNPENQLINGFINEISYFLVELENLFSSEVTSTDSERFEDMVMAYSYKRKLKLTKELAFKLAIIKEVIIKEIPVSKTDVNFSNINKIESKDHYYYVYNHLMTWLLYKGANYTNTNKYFKGISRLDELFERACYYQIIDTFMQLGYMPVIEYNDAGEIFDRITLSKGQKKVNFYYQNLPDSLTTIKNIRNQLKPDFIFEFDDNTFIILDSKYKKSKNIETYDYPDLALKYLHGIGSTDGQNFNILGLLVLFPSTEYSRNFYHKNEYGIFGSKTIYPFIGSIGINFTNAESHLMSTIERVLEIKYS